MLHEHPRLAEQYNGHSKGDILAINDGGYYITDGHWLIAPGVTLKPLTEAGNQDYIQPYLSIMHTQAAGGRVSNLDAWNYAEKPTIVVESHFYGPDMDTGAMIQAMPLNRRADSNYQANRWLAGAQWVGAISFETQDDGGATVDNTPWTLPQLDTIVKALVAIHFTYRIPCTLVASAHGPGIAWHALYANDPKYPWSAEAHSCPGRARIRQMPYIINDVAGRLAHIYSECGETCP